MPVCNACLDMYVRQAIELRVLFIIIINRTVWMNIGQNPLGSWQLNWDVICRRRHLVAVCSHARVSSASCVCSETRSSPVFRSAPAPRQSRPSWRASDSDWSEIPSRVRLVACWWSLCARRCCCCVEWSSVVGACPVNSCYSRVFLRIHSRHNLAVSLRSTGPSPDHLQNVICIGPRKLAVELIVNRFD